MKNISICLVLMTMIYSASCTSKSDNPQLQEAQRKLSETLNLIPSSFLNKDSLRMKVKDMDVEQVNALAGQLESRFAGEIAKARSDREREEKIKAQFDLREGFHIKTKYAVQQSMDDPDSFVHEGTTHVDKGDTIYVTMRFKMRDPSGAIQSYLIESKVDIEGNVLEGDITRPQSQ